MRRCLGCGSGPVCVEGGAQKCGPYYLCKEYQELGRRLERERSLLVKSQSPKVLYIPEPSLADFAAVPATERVRQLAAKRRARAAVQGRML